jgi:toxin YoeB
MKLLWTERAWGDYLHWQASDRAFLQKINELLKDVGREPFRGTGKPEPLRGDLSGWWSRRISGDHRLVYRVLGKAGEQTVEIAACRYHYART